MGSRNKLSQDFLGDLQEDWDQHGPEILRIMRENETYFQGMVKLAMIHRVELGQPQAFERPRTREEVLHKMEERSGLAGRKMLEEFLVRMDKLERGRSSAIGRNRERAAIDHPQRHSLSASGQGPGAVEPVSSKTPKPSYGPVAPISETSKLLFLLPPSAQAYRPH
jgi:hypothetical protein